MAFIITSNYHYHSLDAQKTIPEEETRHDRPDSHKSSTALLTDTIEFLFKKPFIDESCCATNAGIDKESMDRAIPGTGAALHACIEVNYPSLSPCE